MAISFSEDAIELQTNPGVIIFLDFDGTTRPFKWLGDNHPCASVLIELLYDLEKQGLNPGVVISSTWKRHRSKRMLLKSMPSELAQFVVGATPDTPEHTVDKARSTEVDLFFNKVGLNIPWVALDDEPRLFIQEHLKNVVAVNPDTGLVEEDVGRIKMALDSILSCAPKVKGIKR